LQRERSFSRPGFSFEEIEMSLWQAATENIIEAGAPRADTTRDWHLLGRNLCLWLFVHIQEVILEHRHSMTMCATLRRSPLGLFGHPF
jgi:hypothetical protein